MSSPLTLVVLFPFFSERDHSAKVSPKPVAQGQDLNLCTVHSKPVNEPDYIIGPSETSKKETLTSKDHKLVLFLRTLQGGSCRKFLHSALLDSNSLYCLFSFMCMSVYLLLCKCITYVCRIFKLARGGLKITQSWSYRQF